MKYIRIPIDDSLKQEDTDKMTKILPILVEDIRRSVLAGKNILVHCYEGRERSATIVTAYIMKYHKMTPEKAIKLVVEKRPKAFFGGKYINFDESLQDYKKLIR